MVIPFFIAAILFANVLTATASGSIDEIYLWQESFWMESEDQTEAFWNYEVNPLNVNIADRKQLTALPGIQPGESETIVNTRIESGLFKNVDDLIERTGISSDVIHRISGFLVFDQTPLEMRCHVRASRRYGPQTDDIPDSWVGSPVGLTERIWLSADKWKTGILLNKAKYEPSIADQNRFYIAYTGQDLKLIAGDFNISSGLGLILMTRPVFFDGFDSKTPYIMTSSDIAPAVETAENSSFRGIAVNNSDVMGVDFSVFVARTELDAIVNDAGDVLNLSNGGMHRSETEAKKNNTLTETALGSAFSYNIRFDNGACLTPFMTGYRATLDPPLQPKLTDRRRFQLAGDRNSGYGAGCGFEKGNLNGGGEFGIDNDSDAAWKVVFSHSDICLYRWTYRCTVFHYPVEYDNYRAGSPVSGSKPVNREGAAILIKGKCDLGIVKRLKTHFEVVRRPWRTYTVPIPFTSSRASFEAGCPLNNGELRARYRRYNGYDGHGEEADPTKFSDDRLRLWWRNYFRNYQGFDYCRLWLEGAKRDETDQDVHYSSAGGVVVKGNLGVFGNQWKLRYGVSCSAFHAKTDLPVYHGEADLPDRLASVRLSGEGVRWAASLVLKRSRYNWFGLMAARTVQLYGDKQSGDTEVYVTYSYNYKRDDGLK